MNLNLILIYFCVLYLKLKFATQASTHKLDPVWYLNKFGYLKQNLSLNTKMSESLVMLGGDSSNQYSSFNKMNDDFKYAIRRFQRFAHLNVTGYLDETTLKTMQLPRCGMPDILDENHLKGSKKLSVTWKRNKRYALQGSKWFKNVIKYKISKYPNLHSMTNDEIDYEVARAFDLWASVSQLRFQQVHDYNRNVYGRYSMYNTNTDYNKKNNEPIDIEIKFETGYHGDSEPFDGPGFILGHAYFPQFGGSTHFDAEELWTRKSNEGVNLYQVAVHEFGHALGLEHSDNYDAIMAPFFRGYSENFVLNADDITAIQYLYGKNPNQQPSVITNYNNRNWKKLEATIPIIIEDTQMPPTVPPPILRNTNSPPESLCTDGRFDAITTMQDGFTYVFKGSYVYKFDSNFALDISYPKRIRSLFGRWDSLSWVGLPDNLDTALYLPDTGKTYFFKDEFYWRTTLYELDKGYPKLISENFKGLNSRNGFYGKLDASFLWSGNGRVYFVKDDKYWRYDLKRMEVESGYPKSISLWRGLPNRITDALLWANGVTYFFSDQYYYRFNDLAFKVDDAVPSYPRLNTDAWFGCQNRLGNLMLNDDTQSVTKRTKFNLSNDIEKFIQDENSVMNLQVDEGNSEEGVLNREATLQDAIENVDSLTENKILNNILKPKATHVNKSTILMYNWSSFALFIVIYLVRL